MRAVVVSSLIAVAACDCSGPVPGELRPLIEEIPLFPSLGRCTAPTEVADCGPDNPCTRQDPTNLTVLLCEQPTEQLAQFFSVTNIGDTLVTLSSVTFAESDRGPGFENFTEPVLDQTQLFAGDQAAIAFTYFTPDIFTQYFANLVITSDASNATLIVPVVTAPFPVAGEGEGEGEGE